MVCVSLIHDWLFTLFSRYYKENSFSHRTYGYCVDTSSTEVRKYWSSINNPSACREKEGALWVEYHSFLELAPQYTNRRQVNGSHFLAAFCFNFKELFLNIAYFQKFLVEILFCLIFKFFYNFISVKKN